MALNLDNLIVRRPRVQGIGLVKQVISGDTIVVVGSAKNGTPVEKRLILSGISTPRCGNARVAEKKEKSPKDGEDKKEFKIEADEPCAYQAREFLRKRLLGQVVNFMLPNIQPAAIATAATDDKAEFAEVTIGSDNVAELMVQNGFATVNMPKAKDGKAAPEVTKAEDLPPAKQVLYNLEQTAKKNKVGMWAADAKKQVRQFSSVSNADLFNKYHNKELSAYVEYVISGSLYRLEIKNPFNNDKMAHSVITMQLAGVDAPMAKAEAFGPESRKYAAERLQGQEVKIVLQAYDPNTEQLYGTINYPRGNISIKLLQEGLAQYVPWTGLATNNNTELKFTALSSKNGLAKEKPYAEAQRIAYEATVVQIISGTLLVIKANGVEKRVALASVKAPKNKEKFAFEAVEFLRRSLIGKKVNVQVEFIADAREDADGKKRDAIEVVSMFKGKYNIAVELLANGLAQVITPPRDQARSLFFADLCAAQIKAMKEKKAIHDEKAQCITIEDLTARPVKGAKQESQKTTVSAAESRLTQIATGHAALSASIDQVYAPSRIRVILPSQSAAVIVKLAAINLPYLEKDEDGTMTEEEKKANEAQVKEQNDKIMTYIKQFLQYDVVVDIAARQGTTLIANITTKETKENLAVSLLREGLVTLNGYMAEHNKAQRQLVDAQAFAKKEKNGVWKNYDEQKEKERLEALKKAQSDSVGVGVYEENGESFFDVEVTEVVTPTQFYVINTADPNVKVVQDAMAAFEATDVNNFAPRDGEVVAAKFDDDKWYRALVEKSAKTEGANHKIKFLEFGTFTTIAQGDVRPLRAEIAKIPALAKPACLSLCQAPLPNSNYYEYAFNGLCNLTEGKVFKARMDSTQRNGVLELTLTEKGSTDLSINEQLLAEGVLLLQDKIPSSLEKVAAQFQAVSEQAIADHKGVYEYGSYTLDDEKDF